MLEMKEDLLPMLKITGRGLFYSWMPLRRLVILALEAVDYNPSQVNSLNPYFVIIL